MCESTTTTAAKLGLALYSLSKDPSPVLTPLYQATVTSSWLYFEAAIKMHEKVQVRCAVL